MSSAEEPKKVVAAVDSSLAGNPVLVTARALARVLGARVEGIHVVDDDGAPPHQAAAAVGVPLRVVSGPVVERLIEADRADDTAAVVIGARSSPSSPHALGSTAIAVVTTSTKPVVVVPPVGKIAPRIRRVLVPLEGPVSTALAPRSVISLAADASIEVVVLHVGRDEVEDEEAFLRRYCPSGIGQVRLEVREGRREELVPRVAAELECDLIALGWSLGLEPGRAPVIRAALEHSPLPIMLIPVHVQTQEKEQSAVRAGVT